MTLPKRLGAWLVCVALGVMGTSVAAHHGWSNYNQEDVRKVTGKVTAMTWEMPHGTVVLDVEGKAWEVVLAPPSRMTNRGLTRQMIAVGATVTVEAYPHRQVANEMRAERITAAGKTVELR